MSVRQSKPLVKLTMISVIAMLLLGSGVPVTSAAPALAGDGLARTITVVGRGEVHAKPDIARANIGVEVIAPTVAEALASANGRMDNILKAIKNVGVADKDLQTSNFSINFERQMSDIRMPMVGVEGGESAPKDEGPSGFYRVSNMVQVTIRDLDQVADVLDVAVEAGANNVWGVYFGLDDTAELEAIAREKAVADARSRAESLAALTGVEVGTVISVSEVVGNSPAPMFAEAAMVSSFGGGGMPVESGELTFSTQIQIVYEIR